jgi:hypothetical protein
MSVVRRTAVKAQSLYHEVWHCGKCGREFADCTACCAHEAQCGSMSHS